MGCCIIGALIISRWIYAIRSVRRFVTQVGAAVGWHGAARGTARVRQWRRSWAVIALLEVVLLAAFVAHQTSPRAAAALPWLHPARLFGNAHTDADALCISDAMSAREVPDLTR